MNPSTCIEFTLATPDATWSPVAPVVTLPPYLVGLLASGARGVAFVRASDAELTSVVVPGHVGVVTLPTSAVQGIAEMPAPLLFDEYGNAFRIATPPSSPGERFVTSGMLEVVHVNIYSEELVEALAAAFAKG